MISEKFFQSKTAIVTLFAACFVVLISLGVRQTFGLFFMDFNESLKISNTAFGFAIGMQMLMWGLTGPIFGAIADKYGGHIAIISAFIFYTAGIFFLYTGPNTGIFFQIDMGVLIGIGLGGTAISIPMSIVGKHFPLSNRTIAMSIVTAVGSFGYFLSPIFTNYSLKEFGWNYTLHRFIPSSLSANSGDVSFGDENEVKIFGNEYAIYLLDDWDINEKLKINLGFRLSMYQHIGPFTRYYKNQNNGTTDSTRTYASFETIKTYLGPEPRLSARYLLADNSSLKMGFSHNYQYIHLASTSSVSLPTDLWVPSSTGIKPKFAKQYALGYFKNFKDNMFETSLEGYYKEMTNLIEYREGYLPEDNTNSSSDDSFTFGNGDSYGIEVLLKKNRGKTTGWVGYTLSKTTRYFDEVNNGLEFPAKYDRRHDLSITATHQLSNAWVLSSVFVYATGNSITLPTERSVSYTHLTLPTILLV